MRRTLAAGCVLVLAAVAGGQPDRPGREQPQPATVQASGALAPVDIVEVSAQVDGRVDRLGIDPDDTNRPIDAGCRVKKGTVLVYLDAARAELKLERAKANLLKAEADQAVNKATIARTQADLDRMTQLYQSKAAAASDYEAAKAAFELAKAAARADEAALAVARVSVKDAELEVSYAVLKSPVDGVVMERRVNIGQAVRSGPNAPTLFLIASDLKKLRIEARLKEKDVALVKKGQAVTFTVDAFPGKQFKGKVAQVRVRFGDEHLPPSPEKARYFAVVEVDNSDGMLLPFLTARVAIQVGEK
jgi:HlyD family secretion protein